MNTIPGVVERWNYADEELAEAVRHLLPQLNPHAPLPSLEELDSMLQAGDCELLTVRPGAGEPVRGFLALVIFRTPTATHAWLEDVVVDEAWRGQGLGKSLVLAGLQRARERGASRVDLTSNPARTAANALYQALGFERRASNLYRITLA